jgi:hypothetical protein
MPEHTVEKDKWCSGAGSILEVEWVFTIRTAQKTEKKKLRGQPSWSYLFGGGRFIPFNTRKNKGN